MRQAVATVQGQERTHAPQQKSRNSIPSSSAAERGNGTVRPSALAAPRLIIIGLCGLLDWQVGRLFPLRIRPV
jgi:hypothetical protein